MSNPSTPVNGDRPGLIGALPSVAMFGVLAVLWGVAVYRGSSVDAEGHPRHADWRHWEEETHELLRTGVIAETTGMYGYLPGTFVLLMPVAGLPPREIGAALLAGSNVVLLLLTAWVVRRYWMAPFGDARPQAARTPFGAFAGPVLALIAVHIYDPITANQLSLWVLAPMVCGLTLVRLGRPVAGGMLLGLANTVKPQAGLMMVFCLWKREWSAVAGWAAGMVVFEVLPALVFFGWDGAVREHQAWLARAAARGHGVNVEQPWHYQRNQASSVQFRRWLKPLPDVPVHYVVRGALPAEERVRILKEEAERRATIDWDPVAPEGPYAPPYELIRHELNRLPRWSLADLDNRTILIVWGIAAAAAAAGLAAATFGAGRQTSDARWWSEAAAWIVAGFWFTPLLYHNYFVWAFPAVAILWAAVWERPDRLPPWRLGLAWAGLAIWVGAELTRGRWTAEYYGLCLWASIPLAVAVLVVAGGRTGDEPRNPPVTK